MMRCSFVQLCELEHISGGAEIRDTIDGFGPDGMSAFVYRLSGVFSRVQTGFVFHYAFVMLIGVVVMVTWYFFRFMGLR